MNANDYTNIHTLRTVAQAQDTEIAMLKATIADLRTIAKELMQEGENIITGEQLTETELNYNLDAWLARLVVTPKE